MITLCDKAREVGLGVRGRPRFLHWSVPDPAAASDSAPVGYPVFTAIAAGIDTRVRHLVPVLATDPKEAQP